MQGLEVGLVMVCYGWLSLGCFLVLWGMLDGVLVGVVFRVLFWRVVQC